MKGCTPHRHGGVRHGVFAALFHGAHDAVVYKRLVYKHRREKGLAALFGCGAGPVAVYQSTFAMLSAT
jgi:hypothetical protein